MKTFFRLYKNSQADFNSTIFDLVNGGNETKQTKGLAYIFSQYPDFLFDFLNTKSLKKGIKEITPSGIKRKSITSIEISAERFSIDKKRADIIIKIDQNKKPFVAIIIEAKSINTSVNQQALSAQIQHYLDPKKFPDLDSYLKVGIVLTKYNQSIPNIINMTWDIITQLLFNTCHKFSSNSIIKQYFNFLTQIDKSMKYYEKEVLSIPAGISLANVQQYNIYVCPDTKGYNYKKPLFVTFRQSNGGVMTKLYKIEDIIILNPTNQNEIIALSNSTYPDHFKLRIINYINAMGYNTPITYDERFYLLSETESIDLVNSPHPQRNNAKFTYYTLTEILTKQIVVPESKQ